MIAPSAFAQDVAVCGYPISIFFIVVNEFCERFSYYGMRGENKCLNCARVAQPQLTKDTFGEIVVDLACLSTAVLVLYFKYFLRWDDDMATSIYHTFVALCYLTPILGAIVADSWLGKFK